MRAPSKATQLSFKGLLVAGGRQSLTQAKALLEKMIAHAEEDLRVFDELMARSNSINPPMYPPDVLLSVSQSAREHLQTLQELRGILG